MPTQGTAEFTHCVRHQCTESKYLVTLFVISGTILELYLQADPKQTVQFAGY